MYGAPPLRRAIQRLENPFARSCYLVEVEPGSHVIVDSGPECLSLTRLESPSAREDERLEAALA